MFQRVTRSCCNCRRARQGFGKAPTFPVAAIEAGQVVWKSEVYGREHLSKGPGRSVVVGSVVLSSKIDSIETC